jgi:hypothetical protein
MKNEAATTAATILTPHPRNKATTTATATAATIPNSKILADSGERCPPLDFNLFSASLNMKLKEDEDITNMQ